MVLSRGALHVFYLATWFLSCMLVLDVTAGACIFCPAYLISVTAKCDDSAVQLRFQYKIRTSLGLLVNAIAAGLARPMGKLPAACRGGK